MAQYLSLLERLKIANLLRFGWPLRKIAVDLGRSPSTIKRESWTGTETTTAATCPGPPTTQHDSNDADPASTS